MANTFTYSVVWSETLNDRLIATGTYFPSYNSYLADRKAQYKAEDKRCNANMRALVLLLGILLLMLVL